MKTAGPEADYLQFAHTAHSAPLLFPTVERHSSVAIALAGHHECAGNPATQQEQKQHLVAGTQFLRHHYRNIPIIGLWVDEKWRVHEIVNSEQGAAAHP